MSQFHHPTSSKQNNVKDEFYENMKEQEQISQELTKLFSFGVTLCEALGLKAAQPIDLAKSAALSDIFFHDFMYLSKISTAIANNDAAEQSSITQQYSHKSVRFNDLKISLLGFVKILVNQQHVPEFDYSIATPLMNILCLFELKFKETALGNDIIDVRRKSGVIVRWDIDLLDLTSLHWTLLVGSTFPPERRDGLLRTLGPLTLAITLIMEKENQNLVKDAFCKAINYLGDSKKLANWFAKVTDAELGNTLAMLGKIILLNS